MVDSVNGSALRQAAAIARKIGQQPPAETGRAQIGRQAALASVPSLLRQAATIADQGPPVDFANLARIRTAISRGEYPLDTRAIADAMALQAHV